MSVALLHGSNFRFISLDEAIDQSGMESIRRVVIPLGQIMALGNDLGILIRKIKEIPAF